MRSTSIQFSITWWPRSNLDPAMEDAAENLVAQAAQVPANHTSAIIPGLFAGGTIVFIWAFTELGGR